MVASLSWRSVWIWRTSGNTSLELDWNICLRDGLMIWVYWNMGYPLIPKFDGLNHFTH